MKTMNRSEFRSLDAWVAEHVMGYVWARDTARRRSDNPQGSKFKRGTRCLVPKDSISPVLGWARARGSEPLAPAWDFDVPRYTDPSGSFHREGGSPLDVLEACVRKAKYEIEIDTKRTTDGPIRIECGPMRTRIIAIHERFSVAVCLFAMELFRKQRTIQPHE